MSGYFDVQNAAYVQALYEDFTRDPEALSPEWREYFETHSRELAAAGLLVLEIPRRRGGAPVAPPEAPPTARSAQITGVQPPGAPAESPQADSSREEAGVEPTPPDSRLLSLVARASRLLHAFREHGHQAARIDPLGSGPRGHPQLDPAYFGTTMEELEEIPTSVLFPEGGDAPLASTLDRLKAIYGGDLGYEFEHLEDPEKVAWLWDQVERGCHFADYGDEDRVRTLDRLTQVEGLEQFLHRAYLGQKRFSIEGTDMLIPMLDEAIELAARAGAGKVVVGMAHRGRLNVLKHIMGVSYAEILAEFEEGAAPGSTLWVPDPGTGDVKYHHGAAGDYPLRGGGTVKVVLAPNPSHLEFVNPVILGMSRAEQTHGGAEGRDPALVVPILIHGDAAFAAEGVVAETLNLARLKGYEVGGTVHIIANNQVGFTTDPHDGRSTRYASDLAKGYDIPVIHANGDAAEECLAAVRLAMAYRARFGGDTVIDLVGYRRHGHNEGDEPGYTQPVLYRWIADHPTVRQQWAAELLGRGLVTAAEADEKVALMAEQLRAVQDGREKASRRAAPPWTVPSYSAVDQDFQRDTGVGLREIERINEALLAVPQGFSVHPKLARQRRGRGESFGLGFEVSWAHAEALAIGSLLNDGIPIRLTGQDTERGTFSHRHIVLRDARTGARHSPLAELSDTRVEIYNSPLTEAATIGFEYGFAVASERDLVLWEAQFGDFVNVAQVMIDQFLSAGWSKWGQRSRLTLLLPHGYEGQGPEHSSARLERFLQLCAEDNMRVVYPTTPAQYFHMLRLQAVSEPERPLIAMTPKSLLRHPRAKSPVRELTGGRFLPVIPDPTLSAAEASRLRRLVLCSGKVYYDLISARERPQSDQKTEPAPDPVAIARVEALYPFPANALSALVGRYPLLETVVWAQEEPMNMGALTYIIPRLRSLLPSKIRLRHASRPERASPAEGNPHNHAVAQRRIVTKALTG
ncbi:MAG: 2-oxoglutarate dehydrogenase E1 component [Gemmatimonadetes bacterium]|nr:2-oxoglutarate dehydrogenase E1 component [Gemmatimonadota bacterium]